MTLRYDDLSAFEDDNPVILYVGRFTEVKRIPLLIEAYERARARASAGPAPLVIVGGFPGEWEGEHPYDAIRRTQARTSSSPAGTTTPSWPTSSPPPTCSCCRRCASSSAR